MLQRTLAFVTVYMLAACCPSPSHAQGRRGFSVDFINCSEFAGEGPVSLAAATPLVPSGYTIKTAGGNANIVVRATSCQSVLVDGAHPQATALSQIGINIVPPDGTGDINNYTLIYVSNNPWLVANFLAAGLPARFDPQLAYEYTPTATPGIGNLYVAVAPATLAPYFIYGPETAPPPNSAQPFLANWWFASPFGSMRQQTLLPNISFGGSSVSLYTSGSSALGKLIGDNAFSNYSVLSLRGIYPSGHMEVSFR